MKTADRVLFLLLFLTAPAALAGERLVPINAENWAQSGKISFAQIVQTDGLEAGEVGQLKKISLGQAPAYGETRKFSSQAISEALRSQAGRGALKTIRFVIPKEVTIHGAGEILTAKKIESVIETELRKTCADCRYEVSDLKFPGSKNLPPKTVWEIKSDFTQTRGPFSVPIEIQEPGQAKKIQWISGRLKITRDVPVALRPLGTGDRVAKADFKIVPKDVSFATDVPPVLEELVGGQLKSGVSSGQPIWRGSIAREKAVTYGELVTIVTGADAWKVTLKGVARQNAFIGDDAQVMNPDTKKVIVGKVIGKGIVEVK